MRPRIAEAKSGGGFFGGKFRRCFNDGPEWITHHAGIFPVGVIDAPELILRTWSHGCAHGGN